MKRENHLKSISDSTIMWDIVVVGGGATGIGIALDAASRGFKTVLLEQSDFTKATSSRSTKLVHGGVRYLAQGDVALVVDALSERGLMLKNAPHLVKDQRFIIGTYRWWEKAFYTIGLTMYDILAGRRSFGRSLPMRKKDVVREIPGISQKGLRGGVVYHDGQFDDSRMGINLLQTAVEQGATVANYMKVTALTKNAQGKISGVSVADELSGQSFELKAPQILKAGNWS